MSEIKEKLKNAYIQHILVQGEQPKTAFVFAKENDLSEEELYKYYGSFVSIEQEIWFDWFKLTRHEIKTQEVWNQYSSREKALSPFYAFIELIKKHRSFAIFSLNNSPRSLRTPQVLEGLKLEFEKFSSEIIQEGIEAGELMDRPFFAGKYKDALWIQFGIVLNFWKQDSSAGFEKTDEAIEKGVNFTYDLFQRSAIDNFFEYGKFLINNSGMKMPF